MAKAGMRRPDPKQVHGEHLEKMNIPKNDVKPPVENRKKSKNSK